MQEGGPDALSYLVTKFFTENDLFEEAKIEQQVLWEFARKIQSGYLPNPYHNGIHAIDVCQTINFFVSKCNFEEIGDLSPMETAIMYVAGMIHDYEHPGRNNAFQMSTRSTFAITYNGNSTKVNLDQSVLENHHVAASYLVMSQEPSMNIFAKYSREEYSRARERMVSLVLATDMALHFSDVAKIKGRLSTSEFDPKGKDKSLCMESLVHAADISNPIKPFDLYFLWTERILEEFWAQGDEERNQGFAISYLMDRYTTNMAKSQIGFIDVIVFPLYEAVGQFLPELKTFFRNFEENKEKWKEKIPLYENALS